jgi:hypothetical protein
MEIILFFYTLFGHKDYFKLPFFINKDKSAVIKSATKRRLFWSPTRINNSYRNTITVYSLCSDFFGDARAKKLRRD